jgi:hypothetical protein
MLRLYIVDYNKKCGDLIGSCNDKVPGRAGGNPE